MSLEAFFAQNPKAALAFSGGVDSAYLLYAAVKYGCDIQPYFVQSAFQPAFERADAQRLAAELGLRLQVIALDILAQPSVTANDYARCYYCKRAILTALRTKAKADGYDLLLDGTNASDETADRPGMRALAELAVRSPLRECGLSKADIRQLSREAGLFTWDKPAYACLATRIPTHRAITAALLERIEKAEAGLTALGFVDFRVRLYGEAARIQLPEQQMARALALRCEIIAAVGAHFAEVFLDLKGR